MNMGRKPLNKTYEQILAESRERASEYYEENKDEVKKKRMERYNLLKESAESGSFNTKRQVL